MRKPSFTVAALTVVIVTALGVAKQILEPILVKQAANLGQTEDNVLSLLSIKWVPFGKGVFDQAKKRQLPVLLYFYAPYSRFVNDLDRRVLADSELQRNIQRNFVSAKIDIGQFPEWEASFLPLTRTQAPLTTDATMLAVTPDGRIIGSWHSQSPLVPTVPGLITSFLNQSRKDYGNYLQNPSLELPGEKLQSGDLRKIDQGTDVVMPRVNQFYDRLSSLIEPKSGLLISKGMVRIAPSAWILGLKRDPDNWTGSSVDATLRSSLNDWVDGGFFRLALARNPLVVDCSKRTQPNASMLELLAILNRLRPSVLREESYKMTLQALKEDLLQGEEWGVCRVSDQGPDGRSPRASLTIRKSWLITDEKSREWVKKNLMARPDNSSNLATLSPGTIQWNLARSSLASVRAAFPPQPAIAARGRVDASMFTLARIISASKISGDEETLAWAGTQLDALMRIVPQNQIPTFIFGEPKTNYLGSYLAFADACLQDYLATGRYASIQTGIEVLETTVKHFWIKEQNYFATATKDPKVPMNFVASAPQLIDLDSESLTAMALRLLKGYARILVGTPQSQRYSDLGNVLLTKFAGVLDQSELSASGFFQAALDYVDDQYAVCIGPDSVHMSNELARAVPTRMVIPAGIDIRADLASKGTGFYIISGAQVDGPLTLVQARQQLRTRFEAP